MLPPSTGRFPLKYWYDRTTQTYKRAEADNHRNVDNHHNVDIDQYGDHQGTATTCPPNSPAAGATTTPASASAGSNAVGASSVLGLSIDNAVGPSAPWSPVPVWNPAPVWWLRSGIIDTIYGGPPPPNPSDPQGPQDSSANREVMGSRKRRPDDEWEYGG